MGLLRTLFALTVVFGHSSGFVLVGSRNAVQLFYMISGFLISYVLIEKKIYPNVTNFYINRYLRIYPIYLAVAAISLVVCIWNPFSREALFTVYEQTPFAASLLLAVSNLMLFFQDWVMFSGVQNGALVFVTHYQNSEIPLYKGLLVPQAWTLGVELSFYVIAPFVLARRRLLLLLLLASLSVRLYLIGIGLGLRDPWSYRFFPAELSLFLLGALAHQIALPIYRRVLGVRLDCAATAATYVLVSITLVYWLIPIPDLVRTGILFAVFLVLMPLAFVYQSKRRWDQWIGNLSYPVYICHVLVINLLLLATGTFGKEHLNLLAIAAAIGSIGVAVGLNAAIAEPVERLRAGFRSVPRSSPRQRADTEARAGYPN